MVLARRRATGARAAAATGALALSLSGAVVALAPAQAVNSSHGDRVVRANPVAWTPHAMNGSVVAMVQVGNKMIAAGTFTRVSPAGTFDDTRDDLRRNRIFAFDATTGEIDRRFDPDLPGPVYSLDTDGTSIYAAGKFGDVGGDRRFKRIVKLTRAGAVDTAFRAKPDRKVNEVVVRGNRVYIGGQFRKVQRGGVWTQRSHLAALRVRNGAVLPAVDLPFSGVYDPSVGGSTAIKRFDVTRSGDRLVAIGNFTRVGGQPREQVVVLDTSGPTATVAPWNTNRYSRARSDCANAFDNPMRDLDISPDGSFFIISTTGAYAGGASRDTLCDTIARWDMSSTGNDPAWIDYTGGDTTYGVAITGDVAYVGGHFRWLNNPYRGDAAGPGAVPRSGVAALDVVNGLPLRWNPGRARGVGAQAMYATGQGLWVGSDTKRFQGKLRGRIAHVLLDGGTTVPRTAPAALPNTLFMAGGSTGGTTLSKRAVGGDGVPSGSQAPVSSSAEWSAVRGAFYLSGTLYNGTASGTLQRRTFNPSTGALGAPTTVELYDNGGRTWPNLSQVTGMFFDPARHRLYYTVAGQSSLFYRYFTPESGIVGAVEHRASSSVSFASATGVTLAGGRVLYGSSDGPLRSVAFVGGAVTGAPTTVSNDDWRYGALFVPNG
jgi:hypothetical protein